MLYKLQNIAGLFTFILDIEHRNQEFEYFCDHLYLRRCATL